MIRSACTSFLGGNQSRTRAHNEKLVITLLHQYGSMSRAKIAVQTGLSAQSISVIVRKLEAEGLIRKGKPSRGRVGQPSIPLALKPDGATFIGIKIGRRSAEVVRGNIIGKMSYRIAQTYTHPDPDSVRNFILESVPKIVALNDSQTLNGVGISIPSEIWNWASQIGVPEANMARWRNLKLAEHISELTGLPVYTRNDANAACGAELMFGTLKLPANFLHLYFGYFIGGGLVLNNQLFDGATGNAGAIGSIPIGWKGRSYQLIELASISVLEQWLTDEQILTDNGIWNIPSDLLDRWLDQAAASSAHAIAASCAILDLNTVIIDGWMPTQIRAELTQRINIHLTKLNFSGMSSPNAIEGSLGPSARTIGAFTAPFSAHFLIDRFGLAPA